MKVRYVFSIMAILFTLQVKAQDASQDPRLYIDTAVRYMDLTKYVEADEYFLNALNSIDVLSADFCFYFGKNSFYLKKYAQSIDWLNKYLELKGSVGQFSEETLTLLEKAEEAFRDNRGSTEKADVNSKFFYQNTIACDENSVITCPVCRGQGVIITIDRFGEKNYKTCPYSTNGVLTCGEYNLLIQGRLKSKKN